MIRRPCRTPETRLLRCWLPVISSLIGTALRDRRTLDGCGRSSCPAVLRVASWRCYELPGGTADRQQVVPAHRENRCAGLHPAPGICGGGAECLPAEERSVLVLDGRRIEGHAGRQLAAHFQAAVRDRQCEGRPSAPVPGYTRG